MAELYQIITTRIRREMNGAVSGSMRLLDPHHQRKINFGVSVPTIAEICSHYPKCSKTASELRKHNVREWWLAAAYMDEPENITINDADKIGSSWINEEEANVYAMVLFSKISEAEDLAIAWLADRKNHLKTIAAEKIIMRLAQKLTYDKAKEILNYTTAEFPVREIYRYHPSLRDEIRKNGPYEYSWQLDEIDNM